MNTGKPDRLVRAVLVALLAFTASAAQAQTWRNQTDGSAPSASDVSDCRIEGRRQAEQMYPIRPPPGLPQGTTSYDDGGRRSQVENSVFEKCMRRKGYELVDK